MPQATTGKNGAAWSFNFSIASKGLWAALFGVPISIAS
jgi:hypothetical protein